MKKEQALAILYEMAIVVGGEIRLRPLVTKTLQRLLFHTSFPCGMVLLHPDGARRGAADSEHLDLRLEISIGDHELARHDGSVLSVPASLLRGGAEAAETPTTIDVLPARKGYYRAFLRLPIEDCGFILLLAPRMPRSDLPLTRIFQPALANFAKAILLCRSNEAYTESLLGEKAKLHEQLLQSQKMEAVGQLAGGVAHDFNNILTAIMGFGSLLQSAMGPDDPQRENVDLVLQAAERAANLTRSLLTFSRRQSMKPRPESLNDVVRAVDKFLRRVIGEDVQLETAFKTDDLRILGDGGQLQQVLMNLATNARDAMPHGGRLIIQTESVELEDRFIRTHGFGKPGRYALLSVTDTGTGMDRDTCRRIFEPFFTTKQAGRGTGLGLAIAYGIVKQHGGYITVYSEPGHGTTFRIFLPLLTSEPLAEQPAPPPFPQGGTETILLAEDEPTIRGLLASTLRDFGYSVIEAQDGSDAIAKFHEHEADTIDLLVFDVIMPGRSGTEAYDEIRKLRPGTKVLYLTGYTADMVRDRGLVGGEQELLMKPVFPVELVRKVGEILGSPELRAS